MPGSGYFPSETLQLTPDVLANLTALNLTGASLFDFGDNATSAAARKRSGSGCKVFPGDAAWPSIIEWLVFDLLLGGALVRGDPVAAPCYSNWPQYNTAKCASITANWNSPQFQ